MLTKMVTIKCPCCNGNGWTEVAGVYADTYHELKKHGEITGAELARKLSVQPTAMNNRLAWLESKGLAVSRKYGRQKFYSVKGGE